MFISILISPQKCTLYVNNNCDTFEILAVTLIFVCLKNLISTAPMKDLLHTLIQLDKKSKEPSYLQLARQVSACIRNGYLKAGDRLPGIRQFADLFDLHRNTVANSFRLLEDQGWIRSEVGSGTVVSGQNLEEESVR